MYRTVFELIRKNASKERKIDNASDTGNLGIWEVRYESNCFKRDVGIGS